MLAALLLLTFGFPREAAQDPVPVQEAVEASAAEYIAQLRSQDPDERVAAAMLLSLGAAGNTEVEAALLAALGDSVARVRAFVALSLGDVAPTSEAARVAIEARLAGDTDATVRASAAAALARMARPASVPSLAKALGDSDARTRLEAVNALAAIEPAAVRKVLDKVAPLQKDSDDQVRAAVIQLLAKVEGHPAR